MNREPLYIDPYQGRIAKLQGLQVPTLQQHAVQPYLQNRGSEPMSSNAEYNDIVGDHAAYLANQQRLAAQNAYNAQQRAAGLQTNANVEALKQEKAENMVKISQLKAELSQLQATLSDEDSFSRELAANRARIGDIATSRAHQQDITNRFQWKWQADQNEKSRNADKELQKRKEIQTLIGNIEDLDVMLAAPQLDSGTRDALLVKRNRMLRELKAYGKDYIAGKVQPSASSEMTVEQWNEKLSNLRKSAYKGQYIKQSDIDSMRKEAEKWPDSPQRTAAIKELNNLRSEEKQKDAEAKYSNKVNNAVAKAKREYKDGYLPAGGSVTYDGITVKIESGAGGRNKYTVNGKSY